LDQRQCPRPEIQGRFSQDDAADHGGRDRKYLDSTMVREIGPKLAERIVAIFGDGTFEIIEAEPAHLREVSGIGELRATRIFSAVEFVNALQPKKAQGKAGQIAKGWSDPTA
jgi:hypothetical protein